MSAIFESAACIDSTEEIGTFDGSRHSTSSHVHYLQEGTSVCGSAGKFFFFFSLSGEERTEEETGRGKTLLQRQKQATGIKLSLASSSPHFVVLAGTRTRREVCERG